MASYFVVIFKSQSGGFVSEFPDFPEGFTQGDTLEECIEMSQDILDICAEEYTRERRTFPEPSSLDAIKEMASNIMIKSEDDELDKSNPPFYQLLKMPNMNTKPVKVMVSLPQNVLELVDSEANKLGMTRSGFLAKSALNYTEQLRN